jgi:hypothetical protein
VRWPETIRKNSRQTETGEKARKSDVEGKCISLAYQYQRNLAKHQRRKAKASSKRKWLMASANGEIMALACRNVASIISIVGVK